MGVVKRSLHQPSGASRTRAIPNPNPKAHPPATEYHRHLFRDTLIYYRIGTVPDNIPRFARLEILVKRLKELIAFYEEAIKVNRAPSTYRSVWLTSLIRPTSWRLPCRV